MSACRRNVADDTHDWPFWVVITALWWEADSTLLLAGDVLGPDATAHTRHVKGWSVVTAGALGRAMVAD